ncbi:MAG: hypothetical protein ABSA76_05865 [Bacteroidales bacterium]
MKGTTVRWCDGERKSLFADRINQFSVPSNLFVRKVISAESPAFIALFFLKYSLLKRITNQLPNPADSPLPW